MRIRTVVLVAMIAVPLPTAAHAQRIPPGGTKRTPADPAELPKTIDPVLRAQANQYHYVQSHFTFDVYPLISRVQTDGLARNGLSSGWTTLGTGTSLAYRMAPFVSATLDATATALGGPADVTTAELGLRIHSRQTDGRFYPFLDFRAGYVATTVNDPRYTAAAIAGGGTTWGERYSNGWAGAIGAGARYELYRSWYVMTGASLLGTHMSARGIDGFDNAYRGYSLTMLRYSIGVSYNPTRRIKIPGSDTW
jgi:hypothetical protein